MNTLNTLQKAYWRAQRLMSGRVVGGLDWGRSEYDAAVVSMTARDREHAYQEHIYYHPEHPICCTDETKGERS